ncbi:MAG TPA: YihY/virulence factor BrkB family protein [Verrucomicrobiae bacterium]|nr:YihY/virulence factor BrkB family protein [Verrucomicrobiae bacterium]
MQNKSFWGMIKETVNQFSEHRVLRLAAATAYYAAFSIAPLLVLVVGLAGLVFGEQRVQQEVQRQVQSFVGEKSAQLIGSMMGAQHQGGSLVATIVGGAALVLGATGIFGQLQDSLNTIWGVTTKPGESVMALIRDRVFSMAMVVVIGFLLLVSMALTMFVNAFADHLSNILSLPPWLVPVGNALLSFVVIALLFAVIFKVLPDVRFRWREVWVGAIGTAVLFTGGKYLLGLYMAHELSASAYGTGSAFVVILLYVYYSSVILYFGAEFTQVQARSRGGLLEPSKYAVRLTDHDRIQQGIPTEEHIQAAARRQQQQREGPPDEQHRKAA